MKNHANVMMDSGAFSARRQNKQVKLKDYIAFLLEHEEILESYITLDHIPGTEKTRNKDLYIEAARKSYRNFAVMKDAGLNPMPVFHQGEPIEYLERYIAEGEEFIGLGSNKSLSKYLQNFWYEDVFDYLSLNCENNLRIHGLGVGNVNFLNKFPFWSTDSTSWILVSGYGKVFVPVYEHGQFDYTRSPYTLWVSNMKGQTKDHLANLGKHQKRIFFDLCDDFGFDPIKVCSINFHRSRFVCEVWKKYISNITKPISWRPKLELFDNSLDNEGAFTENYERFYYASARSQKRVLDDCNVIDRLYTFYEIMDLPTKAYNKFMQNIANLAKGKKHNIRDFGRNYKLTIKDAKFSNNVISHRKSKLIDRFREYHQHEKTI